MFFCAIAQAMLKCIVAHLNSLLCTPHATHPHAFDLIYWITFLKWKQFHNEYRFNLRGVKGRVYHHNGKELEANGRRTENWFSLKGNRGAAFLETSVRAMSWKDGQNFCPECNMSGFSSCQQTLFSTKRWRSALVLLQTFLQWWGWCWAKGTTVFVQCRECR